MPKAEAGSAKAIGNAMKARGLTKLRYYCQVCQKANRDEHAYRMHCESESHHRQLTLVGQNAGKVIDDFSQQFQDEFVSLLSRRFGTRRIKANQVYQEYIAERHHLHMNATRWVTLTEFVKHLGREGIVHVDESEQGWFISWVDNSPAALKRQAALQKMERQKMDDEGRQRKHLKEQIEKAQKEAEQSGEASGSGSRGPEQDEGLKRDGERGPIKLGISLKASQGGVEGRDIKEDGPTDSSSASSASAPQKPALSVSTPSSSSKPSAPAPFRMGINPLKAAAAPSKASNAFKTADDRAAKSSAPSSKPASQQQPRTMAEKIMREEEERKKRKMSGPMPAGAGGASGGQMKRIRM